MTERERWTVYPLLFLALGLALKDKITQHVNTKTLVCNELLVNDPAGQRQVSLKEGKVVATGEVAASGDLKAPALVCNALLVVNKQGKILATVSTNNDRGSVNVADPQGKVLVSLTSNNDGGLVNVAGVTTGTTTLLGNFQHLAGLIFVDGLGRPHPSSATFVSPVPAKKPEDAAPEKKPAEEKPSAAKPEEQPQPETDAEAAPAEAGQAEESAEGKPQGG